MMKELTRSRSKTCYAVEMTLPVAAGIPPQVRRGFMSAREADIWLEHVRQRVADSYQCSKHTLTSKGFQFRIFKQT
ncbi:MAG: hypothetical protein ABI905_11380 [Betaproteobacteria bacterium]